jgi:hypothetical protein
MSSNCIHQASIEDLDVYVKSLPVGCHIPVCHGCSRILDYESEKCAKIMQVVGALAARLEGVLKEEQVASYLVWSLEKGTPSHNKAAQKKRLATRKVYTLSKMIANKEAEVDIIQELCNADMDRCTEMTFEYMSMLAPRSL